MQIVRVFGASNCSISINGQKVLCPTKKLHFSAKYWISWSNRTKIPPVVASERCRRRRPCNFCSFVYLRLFSRSTPSFLNNYGAVFLIFLAVIVLTIPLFGALHEMAMGLHLFHHLLNRRRRNSNFPTH